MQLSFLGAVGTVTGSKYLLTIGAKKILVDCGLYQGYKELRLRNWEQPPVNPAEVDAVILTHAHIDHSGYLPLFVKNGFKGPIYSTLGTKELCGILLPDCGHLEEEAAYFANKYGFSKHTPALPLYTQADAEKAMPQFVTIPYDKDFSFTPEFSFTFLRAGHILGSAFVRLTCKNSTVLFTGDMGRPHDPIMREPEIITATDYLIIESTYGNRTHSKQTPEDQLEAIINKTVKRGGSVIIPAFAVGRVQSILYYLAQLKQKKLIPDIPIFLDSPMAVDATDIYLRHCDEHRLGHQCSNIFNVATYVNTVDESKEIDTYRMPMIIISASGMATGGRVLHHLKAFAPDQRNTILFTGYQAGGTRGARMLEGQTEIKIHGQMIPVHAKVEYMDNMSAHADSDEILAWLAHFKKTPRKVFITHGEPNAAAALKEKIEQQFGWNCVLPKYLQTEILYEG